MSYTHLFSTSVQFLLYSSVSKSKACLDTVLRSSFPQFLLFFSFFSTNYLSSQFIAPSSIPNNSCFPNTFTLPFFSLLFLALARFIYSQLFVLLTMLQLSLLLVVMLFFSSESWDFHYSRLLG